VQGRRSGTGCSGLRVQRYNVAVPAASPQRQPEPPSPERHPNPHVYTLEATGVLVIAVLILILTLARYWHHISWSAR
jgi:hypothetical protein